MALRERQSVAAWALEFIVLTAIVCGSDTAGGTVRAWNSSTTRQTS
jgi:hypothetical protein